MQSWSVVIALLVGLTFGLAVGALAAFWSQRRAAALGLDAALAEAGAALQARLATAEARLASRDDDVAELRQRMDAGQAELRTATEGLNRLRVVEADLVATLRDERERSLEKLALLTQARDELSAHFKALAGDALEVSRRQVTEQHQGALDRILKPLGEKLVAFEKKVEETYDREAQQRSSLRQEVLNLQAATLQINEDARNLTRALKGEAKTRGNWGEVVLERVLERSGLSKGVEYRVQQTLRGEDGTVSRPDIVVLLPDDKHIVIDSKVSLVAYDSYHAAIEDAERAAHGKRHVEGMRRHARSLGEKNYQAGREIDSPDFVAMFVPIEPAFSLASSLDADLFLDAWDRKVVIVTPSTLLALLMTVQTLWQRDKQTRNAIEIAEQSGALHDQFALVLESLADLGRQLRDAQKAFELTENRLVDGRGNVVGRIKRLQEMGAKTKRQLPPGMIARAGADQDGAGAGDGGGNGNGNGNGGERPTSRLTLVGDVEPK